uniref:procollagen-proline 4-dioxygenase n=1 Tax=Brassica campestris TaxID=3711 RepID=A0A3P5YC33_BRACM|nr:unnamed protein product [Brassica rapa]
MDYPRSFLAFSLCLILILPRASSASIRFLPRWSNRDGSVIKQKTSASSLVFDPTRVTQLSWTPRVFLYKGFLSDEECDHFIKLAKGKLEKSMVADNDSGESVESEVRTSSGMFLSKKQDEIVSNVESRLAAWTFLPEENGESMQILHYENGQKYEPHFDYFHDEVNLQLGGHRIATVLMYLSNVKKGGETVFPMWEGATTQPKDDSWTECAKEGYAVKPVKGDALLFFNLHLNATTDPSSLHGSCPVVEGEKWSATRWIHVKSFDRVVNKTSGCVDENESCSKWAKAGECKKNPTYMVGSDTDHGYCRKSCNSWVSLRSIFMHADGVDWMLMGLGLIGSIGDGFVTPIIFFITGLLLNDLGGSFNDGNFMKAVSKLPNFLMNASAFVASYIVAFIMLWRLTIVGFSFVVLLLIPGLMYGRALISISRKIREEYNEAGSIAEQAISLVRTVYAFGSETKLIAKFSLALQGSVKLGVRQGLVKGISIGSNGIIYAIWAFLTWYGSRMVMYHGAKGGTIFAVIICLTFGGTSLGRGLSNLKYFSEAVVAGERIMEVIERVPEIDSDNLEGQTLEKIKGEVEFKHVKFMYPSRLETPIFDDFCLRVPSGKTVALVGGSGSGKSTVLALLQRFYDPVAGEILLDGVSINKLQVNWLRLQMGLVSQEPALFATTIEENILFGKEDASMDEVVEAAKASNAHNFISQFPQGYKTQVGERGVQMSGGQKQRIAIARAIIKSPTILLLDEATSALDSESERVVQEALDNASLGRTTIVIAHRLSTIRDADVICVVHEGRIVEAGSHEALMENLDGKYTSLVRLQQMDNQESDGNVSVRVQGSQLSILSKDLTYGPKLSSESGSNMLTSSSIESNLPSSDPKGKKPPVPSFKRLMAMNRPEWKHALYGCLSAALFGAVQPTSAFVSGSMVSVYFLTSHDEIKEKTRIFVLFFVGLAVFSFLLNIIQHYSFAYMGEYLTKRIREKMLKKILTFEVNWFDEEENSSGAICSRLAKEANLVRSLVGERVSLLVQTIAAVAVACTVGLVIAWRLAIVMMAAQPVVVVCFYTQRILLKTISKKAIKAQDESSKLAAEAVSNIRTITSFSSQERILKLLKRIQEGPRKESVRQSWLAGTVLATSRSLITCTSVLNFWYGGRLITDGKIVAKQFFEIFTVFVSTGRVIADAGSMTTDLAKGSDAVGSVFAVLDRSTTIEPESPNGYVTEKIKGQISFVNVDFSYLTRPNVAIFKNLSIEIDQGKSTAIVGPSGSGKSTIIALIERFYDPLKGCVKIDGRDLKSYHLRSLRKHIALVSQEPALFAGTIRENIMYGGASENIDESEIIEAAKAANAHDFITSLTDGYDTNCGDRGVLLSGGQKQRIAIARAVLKNPSVLLLDEATSALDSQSERVVQDALERVMIGRTSVVIAHRLSTIQNCDIIAVLDKGKVVECGNHSTLLAKGPSGAYFSLVSLQRNLC